MRRITCFITSLTSGGAEHQLTILTSFLVEYGYDVTLVSFGTSDDHYAVDNRVKRVRIKHNERGWGKLLAIYRYFLTVQTDCVISFGARENFFCLIPLLLRPKIKVLAGERCATYEKLVWYKQVNYSLLYRRANFIVPNSYTQQEDICSHWKRYAKKTVVITNYTDVSEYIATPLPQNKPIRIGIFCRYAEQKNYRRFAYVVKMLKESVCPPFEVHWYGNMHSGKGLLPQYVELDGLVRKLHIGDCLFLHGHTQNVAQELKYFDALCLPSLTEGFSNSISEYMCCGRPILASDVADNKVMVHDGVNGFLFNPESVDDMAMAFLRYFGLTTEKKIAMGKESRQIAERLFDKERFVNSYIKLIES